MEGILATNLDASTKAPPAEGADNILGSDPPTLASLLNPPDTDMQDPSMDVDDDKLIDPEHGLMPDKTNTLMDPALDDPQSECVSRLDLPELRPGYARLKLTQDQRAEQQRLKAAHAARNKQHRARIAAKKQVWKEALRASSKARRESERAAKKEAKALAERELFFMAAWSITLSFHGKDVPKRIFNTFSNLVVTGLFVWMCSL